MTLIAKIQRVTLTAPLVCLLLCLPFQGLVQEYFLSVRCVDKDTAFLENNLHLQTRFVSRLACMDYVNKLPSALQAKGYVTASIDSVVFDSSSAKLVLFVGEAYTWAQLNTQTIDPLLLQAVGWNAGQFPGKTMNFSAVKAWQERMLVYLENNGYPFARIYLDSLRLDQDSVFADLKVDKGPLYRIDSIRVFGDIKISNFFLQQYLQIPNGSLYNKKKLLEISRKILELGFAQEEQPSDLTLRSEERRV